MVLDYHNIDISWLSVDGEDYSTESFRGIYSGGRFKKFGQMMFQMNTSLSVRKDYCPHYGDGCQCGNKNKKNLICSTEGAKCPVEPRCSSEFQMNCFKYNLPPINKHMATIFLSNLLLILNLPVYPS